MKETDKKKYTTLYEKLIDYRESDYYPFHMPGHKRRGFEDQPDHISPFFYDITEIDGFDNLHHPQDLIKKRLEEISQYYDSKKSYYLVNGSTCGILTGISVAMGGKKTLLLARNSHKAAYNAVFLLNINGEYLYPHYDGELGIYGGISVNELRRAIVETEQPEEIGAIFVTSPTYEGVVSDIGELAKEAHKYGIPLIVDEAHGAHFGMHEYFPESSLKRGADLVIQSLHKTLPALTQTAILHVGKESLIDVREVERYLGIYQSSSPSYVLMESIDRCMDYVWKKGKLPFDTYVERLDHFRKKCSELRYFRLFYEKKQGEIFDYDRSKLVIVPDHKFYDGKKLYDRLRNKYHLQMEMASERYVIAMTSVNDTAEGLDRLFLALSDMDQEIRIGLKYRQIYAKDGNPVGAISEIANIEDSSSAGIYETVKKAVVCRKMRDAYFEKYDMIELRSAKGKISEEFIYIYPPGVPLLAPGEIITEEIIRQVARAQELGLSVQGTEDEDCRRIKVVRENWKPLDFGKITEE